MLGIGVLGLGFRAWGLGFSRAWGVGFGVFGLGFRVSSQGCLATPPAEIRP